VAAQFGNDLLRGDGVVFDCQNSRHVRAGPRERTEACILPLNVVGIS
jgi:hypothetical protein